ncbi:DUF4129 domain-containing protein [Roseateles chitinivorans]|uniref:DUF4129 domain-containing protein n=1 Tax=Roseateles chitinivorans TaxID=2917965 RepID=UPI003D670B50
MRSRELLLAGLILAGAGVRAQPVPAQPAASAIDAEAVWAAEKAVQADPLWAGKEKKQVLRFKKSKDEDKAVKKEASSDFGWWVDLIKNLSAGLRLAFWLVGAALLIWVLLRLRDWLQGHEGGRALKATPPTHVGSLDIRPESLPDDIGAAARALWQRGEQRAALSLLYRGALSRLVHTHGVPIRAASTERESLVLAAPRMSPGALDYLSRLVSGWQAVAYAQRLLPADRFEALCADFDARMAAGASAADGASVAGVVAADGSAA